MPITFEEAQANYAMALNQYKKATDDLQACLKVRNELCPHITVLPKSKYRPGGYLHTATTEHWYECQTCGGRSETTVEDHGTYD